MNLLFKMRIKRFSIKSSNLSFKVSPQSHSSKQKLQISSSFLKRGNLSPKITRRAHIKALEVSSSSSNRPKNENNLQKKQKTRKQNSFASAHFPKALLYRVYLLFQLILLSAPLSCPHSTIYTIYEFSPLSSKHFCLKVYL